MEMCNKTFVSYYKQALITDMINYWYKIIDATSQNGKLGKQSL